MAQARALVTGFYTSAGPRVGRTVSSASGIALTAWSGVERAPQWRRGTAPIAREVPAPQRARDPAAVPFPLHGIRGAALYRHVQAVDTPAVLARIDARA